MFYALLCFASLYLSLFRLLRTFYEVFFLLYLNIVLLPSLIC